MIRPGKEEFLRLAAQWRRVPVALELTADTVTPTGMLLRLARSGSHPFLLESVEGGERVARWSFAGFAPERVVVLREGAVQINGVTAPGPPLEALRRELVGGGRAPLPDLPPFAGGAVGWVGYDLVRLLEAVPDTLPDPLGLPQAWFGVYPAVAALDRVRQRLLLVATATVEGDAEGAWQRAVAQLEALHAVLAQPFHGLGPAAVPVGPAGSQPDGRWRVSPSEEEFLTAVARARAAIRAGEAFQIVLSRRWSRPYNASPLALYRALRLTNPAPYMFYLDAGGVHVLGASPETLATLRGRRAVTCPIAGTRRRGATPQEDAVLEAELRADEKENAEHLMLVDLGRNDLGRVAVPGSVEVVRFAQVERYSHVMHLVSEVRGTVELGRDALDVLLSCFPAGTLTGAPKVRAMELIEELEPVKRGVYGGAVGYFDAGGDLDVCIAIRAAIVTGTEVHVQAGAGVVFDSKAEAELAECASKARAVCLAAHLAEGFEP